MATQAWRVIVEREQLTPTVPECGNTGELAASAHISDLPDTLMDQVRLALCDALGRVTERDDWRAIRITVTARAGSATGSSWGFFLIEKPPDESQLYQIAVCLYQDAGAEAI